eukprot:jgi/Chrzof1/10535/Cz05g02110.t1
MTDLRVNTSAIKHAYLPHHDHDAEVLNVTPVWRKGSRTVLPGDMDMGTQRIVHGVKRFFEATRMQEHAELVDLFSHDLLWDGPPIMMSNKGHVRVAGYLFKFLAHLRIIPTLIHITPMGVDRHLIEMDAVAVSYPNRTWLVPATMLLPKSVPKNVHFKIGVQGSLENGKIDLFMGRLTNWPAFFPGIVRMANGMWMGAIPHMFEGLWSYLIDFTGDDYYKIKRERRFQQRHPYSNNVMVDTAKDMVQDTYDWSRHYMAMAMDFAGFFTERAYSTAMEYGQWILNMYSYVFNTVFNAAASTAGATAAVAGGAYGVAADTAGAATETGRRAAGAAYGAAANTAGAAYGAAANTADAAYGTVRGVANQAYDAYGRAYDAAYDATKDTAVRAVEGTRGAVEYGSQAAANTVKSAADATRDATYAATGAMRNAADASADNTKYAADKANTKVQVTADKNITTNTTTTGVRSRYPAGSTTTTNAY